MTVSMNKPRVCILRTDGTNCDEELFYAFEKFGAAPEMIHVNQLRNKSKKLSSFQILALPGGFSYGDDVASGKILAVELISFLKSELQNFIAKKGLILGICNGFQTLVRTGLLPFNNFGKMDVTLAGNDSGHFECRWVKLKVEKSKCAFLNPLSFTSEVKLSRRQENTSEVNTHVLELAVNHGEGKFYSEPKTIQKIEDESLVTFRYVDESGQPTNTYPQNPNGSLNAIAGVCDPSGRILGLMPHPEKFVDITQYPNWRREKITKPHGAFIFEELIKFASNA